MSIINSYTTKQALKDGVLIAVDHVDYSKAGIKFPVNFTDTTWKRYVEVPKGMEHFQDLSGRLWDVLFMFAIKAQKTRSSTMRFSFVCQLPSDFPTLDNEDNCGDGELLRGVTLKAVIGPRDIDDPRPGITIMFPNED